jgi:hypothetical protein
MKAGLMDMLDKAGDKITEQAKDEKLKSLDRHKEATQFLPMLKSYAINLAVSGVVALLVSLIIKKEKPITEEQ